MTVKQAYEYARLFLQGNGVDEYDFKALCLVCHIACIENNQYNMHTDDDIIMSSLADKLWQLKSGRPIQYVIGQWDFYESIFFVGDGVLIPRPETEELVDLAIRRAGDYTAPIIFDLCSGSGCIGISIAKKIPSATVYCVEKSEEAFSYLLRNANGVPNVVAICDDIYNDIDLPSADIIVSNPPYIRSDVIPTLQEEVRQEPAMALDGGADGLDFYRLINDKWSEKLNENGLLLLEIGNDQGETVPMVLTAFDSVETIRDIYGNDRIVLAKR